MSNIDIVTQLCVYCDYPLYKRLLAKYRNKFNKIILYPSRHHGVIDLEKYLKEAFLETWVNPDPIDWTTPGIDWRQVETEPCLKLSNSEWVLFLEQDFFCDNWDKLWKDVEKAMESADMIGWWSASAFPYIHPCFLLIKRELLDRTNKDFRAHPEIDGSDHFAMVTKDAQELGAKIIKLQDLGWTDPEHAFHLGGLTYPYQDFKGEETIIGCKYPSALSTYNQTILELDLHPEFKELCLKLKTILADKGYNYFPKWSKFFKI